MEVRLYLKWNFTDLQKLTNQALSIKKTQDDATIIHLVDKKLSIHYRKQKKVLFEPALLLLKVINSCTKWVFSMIGQYEFSVSSEVVVCTRC